MRNRSSGAQPPDPAPTGARGEDAADGAAEDAADGGVIARVQRRTAVAGATALAASVAIALCGWVAPGWFVGPAGTAVGSAVVVLCLAVAAVLFRRVALWRAAWRALRAAPLGCVPERGTAEGRTGEGGTDWVPAACGTPMPFRGRNVGPAILRRARKHPPQVLPLRTRSGPLAAGQAVIVHARPDGKLPTAGGAVRVRAAAPRGPYLVAGADGTVFVADRWSSSLL